ncbi:MAG TPA: GNAT family N-acetyltransferase [Candidatus Kapabacteria bacterium]|nr:GNAT family N-acetyltransferase [Candidatus Kapabacteria bacterium]
MPRDFESHLGQCWIILDNGKIAGYITLLADRLTVLGKDLEPKQMLRSENVEYSTFPAVKIGLLAADKRARGAGKRLLYWAIDYVATTLAPRLGVRFLTVDAAYDTDSDPHYDISSYYASFGFEYAIPDESLPPSQPFRTMFVDLKPFIDAESELA